MSAWHEALLLSMPCQHFWAERGKRLCGRHAVLGFVPEKSFKGTVAWSRPGASCKGASKQAKQATCVSKGLRRKAARGPKRPGSKKRQQANTAKNDRRGGKGKPKKIARRSQTPAFQRGWPEKRPGTQRPEGRKSDTKKNNRNPKRPKSFWGNFASCLRQLLALRATQSTLPE